LRKDKASRTNLLQHVHIKKEPHKILNNTLSDTAGWPPLQNRRNGIWSIKSFYLFWMGYREGWGTRAGNGGSVTNKVNRLGRSFAVGSEVDGQDASAVLDRQSEKGPGAINETIF